MWHERLTVATRVALDLDGEHLDIEHLLVEEPDNPREFVRYAVDNEQQAQLRSPQIRSYLFPELIRIGIVVIVQQLGEHGAGLTVARSH